MSGPFGNAGFFVSMSQMNRFLDFLHIYIFIEGEKLGKKFLSDNEFIDFQKNGCFPIQSREKRGDQLVGSCRSITLERLLCSF